MKIHVVVKPKEAVLDPQGAAVRDAMHHLGMPEVRSVRIGKFMEIEVEGNGADLEKRLHDPVDEFSFLLLSLSATKRNREQRQSEKLPHVRGRMAFRAGDCKANR